MKTWIKLYTEIVDDPKIGRHSLADHGLWLLLMALAGKIDHRDEHGNATGQLDTLDNVAWHLRRSTDEIAPGVERLTAAGMLHVTNGIITVTHFAERQERPSETPAAVSERVKRHRAKARREQSKSATSCNAYETTCNDDETALESESDSETESETDPEQTTTDTDRAQARDADVVVCFLDAGPLRAAGVTEPALSNILGRNLPPGAVQEWIDYANNQSRLKNKAGFLVAMLTRPGPYAKPPPYQETPATAAKPKTWFTDEEYERFFLHTDQPAPRGS
jgi:hypothetical protein